MMTREFKFEPRQNVKTPFGDVGFVSIAGVDEAFGTSYYVQRSSEGQWFREDQLDAVDD